MQDSLSVKADGQFPDEKLDSYILDLVTASSLRMTPIALKRQVKAALGVNPGQYGSSIKRLVQTRELVYTYQFGTAFLEPSFEKAVRITDTIVLKPPACSFQKTERDVVIDMRSGAAFGSGCHPTTRLSLKALEAVSGSGPFLKKINSARTLDIGTGSGVLAIAAVKLGARRALGLDIDPCARAEAVENVKLNDLADRIEISSRSMESLTDSFFIVIANLRWPTLKSYFHRMAALTDMDGFVIVSGIKSNEIKSLKNGAHKRGMTVFWEGREHDWAALAMVRDGNHPAAVRK